jgi:4-aminobutyrate aminotransferase-like enzyme/Ser/Thr protein kinase RdoA (MazF antagonist)
VVDERRRQRSNRLRLARGGAAGGIGAATFASGGGNCAQMVEPPSDPSTRRPAFALPEARALLMRHFGIDGELRQLDGERDQNLHVRSTAGEFVLKIVHADEPPLEVAFQDAMLRHLEVVDATLPVPRSERPLVGGERVEVVGEGGRRHALRLLSYLPGTPLAEVAPTPALLHAVGCMVARLDQALAGFGHPGAFRAFDWNIAETLRSRGRLDAIVEPERRAIVAAALDRFERNVLPILPRLRHGVIHNDAHDGNILVDGKGDRCVGIFDFGDAVFAPLVAELSVTCTYAMLIGCDVCVSGRTLAPGAVAAAVVAGYVRGLPLHAQEIAVLPDLIAARLCISLTLAAVRGRTSTDPYLFVSKEPGWRLLGWLHETDRRQFAGEIAAAAGSLPPSAPTAQLMAQRQQRFGKNVKLSYQKPLHIVRGDDVWLTAADGRRYLDCYNNVAHVGHCHPRVVAALTKQASQLNTNTRYLHENVLAYAERLRATLPPSLDTFFFVNSGSEANDLALRIVRGVTGRRDIAVFDWAYHGHTEALIDISPWKYKRRGGAGRPAFVHELSLPDVYRAPEDWPAASVPERFVQQVTAQIEALAATPAALFAETIPSVAGQMFLPPGFLAAAHAAIRRRGGLCVADEVQVGFGRTGTMWAFEQHGVVPDIVTMGKPAGAGHPLGILVTTRAIADAFATGMEYFNTFGGNPVSAAVGLAVLDVLRDQDLLANSRREGDWLLAQFRALMDRHERLGDVRGQGLFFGLELVTDRASKRHDGATANAVVEHALQNGVLMGTDGPHDNVVKLRPPMTFAREHSEQLLAAMDAALGAASP